MAESDGAVVELLHELQDGLLLGCVASVSDDDALAAAGVTHALAVTPQPPALRAVFVVQEHLAPDTTNTEASAAWLERCVNWCAAARCSGGRVVVYGTRGVRRGGVAADVGVAHLLLEGPVPCSGTDERGASLLQALRRCGAQPKRGHLAALLLLELRRHGRTSDLSPLGSAAAFARWDERGEGERGACVRMVARGQPMLVRALRSDPKVALVEHFVRSDEAGAIIARARQRLPSVTLTLTHARTLTPATHLTPNPNPSPNFTLTLMLTLTLTLTLILTVALARQRMSAADSGSAAGGRVTGRTSSWCALWATDEDGEGEAGKKGAEGEAGEEEGAGAVAECGAAAAEGAAARRAIDAAVERAAWLTGLSPEHAEECQVMTTLSPQLQPHTQVYPYTRSLTYTLTLHPHLTHRWYTTPLAKSTATTSTTSLPQTSGSSSEWARRHVESKAHQGSAWIGSSVAGSTRAIVRPRRHLGAASLGPIIAAWAALAGHIGLAFNVGAAGNRLVSVLVYLSCAAEGGETQFTSLGLSVTPTPGTALLWHNFDRKGVLDRRTLHCGRPVLAGEKWGMNIWFRQRPLTPLQAGAERPPWPVQPPTQTMPSRAAIESASLRERFG